MNHDPTTGTFYQTVKDWERKQDLWYGSCLENEDLCVTCGEELRSDEAEVCSDCLDSQS